MKAARRKTYAKRRLGRSTRMATSSCPASTKRPYSPCGSASACANATIGRSSRRTERDVPRKNGTASAPSSRISAVGSSIAIVIFRPHQDSAQCFRRQHERDARDEAIYGVKAQRGCEAHVLVFFQEQIGNQPGDAEEP